MNVLTMIEPDWTIEKLEWAKLQGKRPRIAGANARLGVHGQTSHCPILQITIAGQVGFGSSLITNDQGKPLIGKKIVDLFDRDGHIIEEYRLLLEYPLLDWLGRMSGKPVYSFVAEEDVLRKAPLRIPCYDTSLYFDDLHLEDVKSAVSLMKEEALQGKERGHLHFKIKVGRGARHLPMKEGTIRDIAIVDGIGEIAGPEGKLMIDANNGYTLNITKEVLSSLSHTNLYWIEEAFHEDGELYADLKAWMNARNMQVLIADGEGDASPHLISWAKRGLVDVLQYDIIHPGFTHWLELGAKLDRMGVKSAPHCYGNHYGVYASCHLAPAIGGFQFVEWDEHIIEGIDTSAYRIRNGMIDVPDLAGFGVELDAAYFANQVAASGWRIE